MTFPLFVVTGPSGVGKGTVIREILAAYPQVWLSVSATTREPRPGEVDGREYSFVSRKEFEGLLASGGMIEWADVFGMNLYGTPRAPVEQKLDEGRTVILELDLEGSRQVRVSEPRATHIFIAPPDVAELERRLRGRGTEDSEAIERRLETARTELAAQDEFDFVVVNHTVRGTAQKLAELMGLKSR